MKIFSKLASALMVLPVVAALTACSDDDGKYTPAQTLTNAQVYFSNELASTVALSKEEGKFTVALNRIKTDEPLTVNLAVEQDEEAPLQFNVPASVTFEEGQNVAEIEVTYDPEAVEYEEEYKATISIADSAYTTPYGLTQYTFTGTLAAPWADMGMATYREDFVGSVFTSAGNLVYKVPMQKNLITDGLYRLVNPYGAIYPNNGDGDYDGNIHYMVIHAEDPAQVWIENMDTGLDWGYGELSIGWRTGGYGTLENGIITFPAQAFLIKMANYNSGNWSWYGNNNGLFALALPGYDLVFPDYSVEVEYQGILTDASSTPYAQVNAVLGSDVQKALAYVVEADADADAVADALASGEVEGVELVNGINNVPLGDLTGSLQVVVASVVDGEVQYADAVKFEYYGGGKSPWQSLGVGLFTDNFFITMYSPDGESVYDPYDLEVEIQESTEEPGLYRLVNPFEAYGFEGYVASNLDINATDPEGVYFTAQQTGIDDGDGMVSIASVGGYNLQRYSFDQLKEAGYFGELSDGVITLPSFEYNQDGRQFTYQGFFLQGTSGYYTGTTGEFKVVLPSAVTNSARAKARANGFAKRMKLQNSVLNLKKAKMADRNTLKRSMVKFSLSSKAIIK